MLAAWNGHTDIALTLLGSGAEVNAKDMEDTTALIMAAYKGHAETVRVLLEGGANVNGQNNDGGTALMIAAYEGESDTVKTLLSAVQFSSLRFLCRPDLL